MARKVYMVDTENVSSSWRMVLADMTRNDILYLFYTEHSPGIGYADFKEIMESEIQPEMISCYSGKNGLDFQLVSYLGYLLKSAGKTEYIIISNDMGYDSVIHFWTDQGYKVTRMTVYDLIQRKKERIIQKKELEAASEKAEKEAEESKNTAEEKSRSVSVDDIYVFGNSADISKETENIEEKPKKSSTSKTAKTLKKRDIKKKENKEAVEVEETIESLETITEEEDRTRQLLAELLSKHEEVDVDIVIEILRHGSIHQLQKIYTQMLKLFGHETGVELYHVLKPHFSVLFTYAKQCIQ